MHIQCRIRAETKLCLSAEEAINIWNRRVDGEPAKYAKWITINSVSRCSNCEYIPPYDRAIDDIFYSAYCPNCGAKMENAEAIV